MPAGFPAGDGPVEHTPSQGMNAHNRLNIYQFLKLGVWDGQNGGQWADSVNSRKGAI